MFASSQLNSAQRARLLTDVRAGRIVQVRRGYYEHSETWSKLYNYDKHKYRSIALGNKLTTGALTGASAATVLGLPIRITADTPLAFVGRSKSHSPSDKVHRVSWSAQEQASVQRLQFEVFTVPVTGLPFCLAELARSLPTEEAVVAMDHCLHNKTVTVPELTALKSVYSHKPRINAVSLAVELSEPLTESPMETRLRLALLRAGFSGFLIQPDVVLFSTNRFIRPDFLFPSHQLIVEYDGQAKYLATHTAAYDDMARMHDAANSGFNFLRVNRDTFKSGSWLRDLKLLLSRPAVAQHPDVEILGGRLITNQWV